jgi:hypothetical protein
MKLLSNTRVLRRVLQGGARRPEMDFRERDATEIWTVARSVWGRSKQTELQSDDNLQFTLIALPSARVGDPTFVVEREKRGQASFSHFSNV